MKFSVISLGCPKNQVDADRYTSALQSAGHEKTPSPEEAEVILINTCGFIEAAKSEAIEAILDACRLKADNPTLKVVVTGCLAERYRKELAAELPEVDAVVGIGGNSALPEVLAELEAGKAAPGTPMQCYGPKTELPLEGPRVIGTPGHYAWLKIAEGCSNNCTYCAIPGIRGPMRSRPLPSILEEAAWLAGQGVREIVLVAQDVSAYGMDEGEAQIGALLDGLQGIRGIVWIRLLYAYPERISPEFVAAMRRNRKVLPYLDLPVQHCDDEILRRMGRKGGRRVIEDAVALLRRGIPGITLRTSLIAGFPGETEAQFEALCAFVREMRFERLGCFAYSPEEGTPAAKLPGQLPEEERTRRAGIVNDTQGRLLFTLQEARLGREETVICDGLDEEEGFWRCRAACDAPEIDTEVLVPASAPLRPGGFACVIPREVQGADLLAEYAVFR